MAGWRGRSKLGKRLIGLRGSRLSQGSGGDIMNAARDFVLVFQVGSDAGANQEPRNDEFRHSRTHLREVWLSATSIRAKMGGFSNRATNRTSRYEGDALMLW